MLEERIIQMINADLDGELGQAEKEELDAILESSAEARSMRVEMLKLTNLLDSVPEVAPPPGLSEQILNKLTPPPRKPTFSLAGLKEKGVPFMTPPPETYYEMLEERLPGHGEPVDELKARGILLDGSTEEGDPRLLLQIFSETMIGPVFFEFIQRKKDEGFGEGNFTALFEPMERDQLRRGVLEK
mgnify:CR=1 FL=1